MGSVVTSGSGHSSDPRAVRTRARLAGAFTAITARDPGVPVTVSAIVAEAGLNRSSFYAHFDTTGALAVYVLEQALRDLPEQDLAVRLSDTASGEQASRLVLGNIVDQVERQRTELVAVFGSADGGAALARFGQQLADNISYYFERIGFAPMRPPAELATAAVFLGHGLAAAVAAWLAEPRPREELIADLVALVPAWVHAPGPR
ncbi:hypothetical protein Cs7R123_49820 [Catellatospora sp. TT07R-123]|uniref:TetR/AcrR family transcriptional regulator n=1 Tax=Catellatospora sp. TT07R-123 TaxID=2733863 RepID=UPI001B1E90D6|nr:TetR/AcrR family transcriptional regulator [Catellatospora sp. TT07R-123]GHJ47640.1 hypothetical protein Cs7R123_49820 [Catellatospora sp. TT07R-123]